MDSKMASTKEYRDGYVVKTKSGGRVAGKLPFYCPRNECGRITDSMDDKYLRTFGICAECYITQVEDRKQPLVDVEFYRKRLKERGY